MLSSLRHTGIDPLLLRLELIILETVDQTPAMISNIMIVGTRQSHRGDRRRILATGTDRLDIRLRPAPRLIANQKVRGRHLTLGWSEYLQTETFPFWPIAETAGFVQPPVASRRPACEPA